MRNEGIFHFRGRTARSSQGLPEGDIRDDIGGPWGLLHHRRHGYTQQSCLPGWHYNVAVDGHTGR